MSKDGTMTTARTILTNVEYIEKVDDRIQKYAAGLVDTEYHSRYLLTLFKAYASILPSKNFKENILAELEKSSQLLYTMTNDDAEYRKYFEDIHDRITDKALKEEFVFCMSQPTHQLSTLLEILKSVEDEEE